MFQLSIFIPHEAHTYLSGTPHPPDPPEAVKVLPQFRDSTGHAHRGRFAFREPQEVLRDILYPCVYI